MGWPARLSVRGSVPHPWLWPCAGLFAVTAPHGLTAESFRPVLAPLRPSQNPLKQLCGYLTPPAPCSMPIAPPTHPPAHPTTSPGHAPVAELKGARSGMLRGSSSGATALALAVAPKALPDLRSWLMRADESVAHCLYTLLLITRLSRSSMMTAPALRLPALALAAGFLAAPPPAPSLAPARHSKAQHSAAWHRRHMSSPVMHSVYPKHGHATNPKLALGTEACRMGISPVLRHVACMQCQANVSIAAMTPSLGLPTM